MESCNSTPMTDENCTTKANVDVKMVGLVDPMSTTAVEIFSLVNVVSLCLVLAVSGIVANVINLCVFYKQGLNNSMNISFFVLAESSLLNTLFILWRVICVFPSIDKSGYPIVFNEIKLLTAGWPNACVSRIICWITVYITAERCFSITIPLKVKLVFTSRRAVVVLALIYVINFMTLIPEYCVLYLDWKFFPSQNKTMIGLVYRTNRPPLEGLTSGLNAIFSLSAFFTLIIFTTILVQVLKRNSKWRSKLSSDKISSRQKKTVTMVIALACVMIVCYTTSTVFTFVTFFIPEFSAYGKLVNSHQVVSSFIFLSHAIDANINIVLYYRMSSKYKTEFNKLFRMSTPTCNKTDKTVYLHQQNVSYF